MSRLFLRDSKGRFARNPLSKAKIKPPKKKKDNKVEEPKLNIANELNLKANLGGASEVVFCFDTTGSMQPCIANVRKHIAETCVDLFRDLPGIKIGLIAHGDYCDGPQYCMRTLPLTNDSNNIFNFVKDTPNTSGGDAPECYEYALFEAQKLGWTPEKKGKVLVMIGDDEPHIPNYSLNTLKLDWTTELNKLKLLGITVYSLQCLYRLCNYNVNSFWSTMSERFNTPLLKLQDMGNTSDILKGAAYMSAGVEGSRIYSCSLKADSAPEVKTYSKIFIKESEKFTTKS